MQTLSLLCLLWTCIFTLAWAENLRDAIKFSSRIQPRASYPDDITGKWRFAYSQNSSLCPETIEHLKWERYMQGPFRVPHEEILHDGVRCNDAILGYHGRLRFYHGTTLSAIFNNLTKKEDNPNQSVVNYTEKYYITDRMLYILNSTGPNIDARWAADKRREPYLVGYESTHRVCDGKVLFPRGSTGFIIKPSAEDITIPRIDFTLEADTKWLVMVPLYKGISCVYKFSDEDEEYDSTQLESSSENELEASTRKRECFPASAWVQKRNGEALKMRDVSVGDDIHVGNNLFSPVFMFTHQLPYVISRFVRFQLDSGDHLAVTPNHYVYADGQLITAQSVRLGQRMILGNGSTTVVLSIDWIRDVGLFNPQTSHGDIVVNNVLVSTYTQAVEPLFAHALRYSRSLERPQSNSSVMSKSIFIGVHGEDMGESLNIIYLRHACLEVTIFQLGPFILCGLVYTSTYAVVIEQLYANMPIPCTEERDMIISGEHRRHSLRRACDLSRPLPSPPQFPCAPYCAPRRCDSRHSEHVRVQLRVAPHINEVFFTGWTAILLCARAPVVNASATGFKEEDAM
ncbi:hypothetical protein FGB62_281g017 [Gracilaria domingensis]|nr:hypothetical protein FGB62_281g017 [Gracilaria domingensis]